MAGSKGGQASTPHSVSIADRYELAEGEVFMTGVQALVRALLDQRRADEDAGLHGAALVSGYQGSPLGGFDKEVARLRGLGAENGIRHQPAVNEELGATAVWGSQLTRTLPGAHVDGVIGVWYGKSPGLDRSADAVRHGNYVGTDPRGGVIALVGDDPACKSSTIPGASESLLAALKVPVFVPGDIQEALDLARHAIYCSRASGLWSALKVVTNVADAAGTVAVGLDRVRAELPLLEWEGSPYVHSPSAHLLAPNSLEMERTLNGVRLEIARRYATVNRLNRTIREAAGARLGIVAAGTAAHDARGALAALGVDESTPVRLLQLQMIFPLERESLVEFADGLEEIIVIEEKGPFLEHLVKDALYGSHATPTIVGHRDDRGAPLLPGHGVLDVDAITRAVGARLLARGEGSGIDERLRALDRAGTRTQADLAAVRTPFFCSGCPHNSSLVAPDGEIVGAGIGCHTMVMTSAQGHGDVRGITQMGGEGVQWIGAAPFVDVGHFTQNLGDGTFHHSGSLAIRAAIAANLNVTYKLLFNGTVAMTGGQDVEGGMNVMDVVRSLAAEGVKRIVVTAEDLSSYDRSGLPPIAELRARRDLLKVQRELAQIEGVTVLIHDQACAAELRRARKRGKAPEPPQHVLINERVCEGCGDCGVKSGCLSVEPVETEFGRKTRIDQTSCNKDFSCLDGDCPSFLTVIPGKSARLAAGGRALPEPPDDLPEPSRSTASDVRIRMVGIGGTGVVTVSQIVGMAALLDGRHASGLDQTGLSQKAGPVVSDVRLTEEPVVDGVTLPDAAADVILGFDILGTARQTNLRKLDPDRSVAIVSETVTPTGQMVIDVDAAAIDVAAARRAIQAATRSADDFFVDAKRLSEELLGDATPANVLLLGSAWQRGLLPISLGALQEAVRLNGASVERNLAAIAWGRAAVVAPEKVAAAMAGPTDPGPSEAARSLVAAISDESELAEMLQVRVDDLIGWGGKRAARSYLAEVKRVLDAEDQATPGRREVTLAFARGLHKLTAYKDEYEVARLHLEGLRDLPRDAKIKFHLHPPLLRAMGMRRKLKLGRWFIPAFRLLRRGRFLRGTPFDPFGYARVRRVERRLPGEYVALLGSALEHLDEDPEVVIEIAELPELVRGYEEIKLAGVERFHARASELGAALP